MSDSPEWQEQERAAWEAWHASWRGTSHHYFLRGAFEAGFIAGRGLVQPEDIATGEAPKQPCTVDTPTGPCIYARGHYGFCWAPQ